MKLLLINMLFLILCIELSHAQNLTDTLDLELSNLYSKSSLPGFCLSIINADNVIYQRGFGFSNKELKIEYNQNTIQPFASISKTLIAISVMKAIEKGYFTLETDINDILPFEIQNPNFPNDTIKIKHLVTHTSGIIDKTSSYIKAYYLLEEPDFKNNHYTLFEKIYLKAVRKNKKVSLDVFLKAVLSKEGHYYSKNNFGKNKAGEVYQYSNIASSLVAYIIEIVSNKPFYTFTHENIFVPLGMNSTGWNIYQMDSTRIAILYSKNGFKLPKYSCSNYPDGSLSTSSDDMCKLLLDMMKGSLGGGSLMNSISYQTMFSSQYKATRTANSPNYLDSGIFWELTEKGWIGHSGSDPGVYSYMYFNPMKKIGIILVTNTQCELRKKMLLQFNEIWKTGVKYANQYSVH